MATIQLLACLVLAPLGYALAGLPWAVAARQPGWALLLGAAVTGFTAELAAVAGAPVAPVVFAVAGLHGVAGAWLVARGAFNWRAEAAGLAWAYGLALVPLVAAPFPLPGDWGGDWALALEGGRHVLDASRFPPELLARPPLFGAAAIPLLAAGPVLPAYQVFCAVASAGALQVVRAALPPATGARLLLLVAGSVFFLQVTANAWAKFLSAAYLLAAWQWLAPAGRSRWPAGLLLGLAVATHQAAVLFAPWLLLRCRRPGEDWSRAGRAALALGAAAAVVVLPWELHTLATYGWAAKYQANPAVAQRLAEVPAWLNALLVGLTTLVAWGPVQVGLHWLAAPDRFSPVRLAHEAYWFLVSTCNGLAGSLLGLVLPWALAAGPRAFLHQAGAALRSLTPAAVAALAAAAAGQMLLNPYYSPAGCLQTGWVPAGLALGAWWAAGLAAGPAEAGTRALRFTGWLGAGPWLVFNLGLTTALALGLGARLGFVDDDLVLLQRQGWTTLALAGFPWLQVLLAGLLGWLWLVLRRPPASPVLP